MQFNNTRGFLNLPTFYALAICWMISQPTESFAADEIIIEPPSEVERWYGALGSANRRDFDELIGDDAKIILKDLGIEQTKQEFIKALDEWEKSTRDASIVYRYKLVEDNKASVQVCYRFKSNEQLNLEYFTFLAGKITGSVQEFKGADCGDM